jgi:hypothetical protein
VDQADDSASEEVRLVQRGNVRVLSSRPWAQGSGMIVAYHYTRGGRKPDEAMCELILGVSSREGQGPVSRVLSVSSRAGRRTEKASFNMTSCLFRYTRTGPDVEEVGVNESNVPEWWLEIKGNLGGRGPARVFASSHAPTHADHSQKNFHLTPPS